MELSALKLASDRELISELLSRYDACLIATLKSRPNADCFYIDWHGLTACVGLAERAKARLIAECLEPSEDGLTGEE
jgi:hypothetical protein